MGAEIGDVLGHKSPCNELILGTTEEFSNPQTLDDMFSLVSAPIAEIQPHLKESTEMYIMHIVLQTSESNFRKQLSRMFEKRAAKSIFDRKKRS